MKKKLSILILVVLGLVSCQEPIQTLVGTYSFKTSGVVEVEDIQMVLPNESGTLELQQTSEDELRMVFNQMGGGVYTATATLMDNVIMLYPFDRTITVNMIPYELVVTGQGQYNDGIIVFELQYHGTSLIGSSSLSGGDILMIAKKNGK